MSGQPTSSEVPLPHASTDPTVIPRSPRVWAVDLFRIVFDLNRQQTWLEARQERLIAHCDDVEQQHLICDLLYRFHFVRASEVPERMKEFANYLVDTLHIDPEQTAITALAKGHYSDSSQYIAWLTKAALANRPGWSTTEFLSTLSAAVNEVKKGKTRIVVVDEFVGSGKTVVNAVGWLNKQLAAESLKADIVVAAIVGMTDGIGKVMGAGIEIHCQHILKKGISQHFTGADLTQAISAMKALEGKLSNESNNRKLADMSFGFAGSESLYFLEGGNPPNNVFPIFWWKHLKGDIARETILERV